MKLIHIPQSCWSIVKALVGRLWRLLVLLSAAAAQAVRYAAADAAADAADQGEDQRRHHRRDDRPEPPDGLTAAALALGHDVGALGVLGAGPPIEFGKSFGDAGLGIIEELCSITFPVISEQVSWSGCKNSLCIDNNFLSNSFLIWLTNLCGHWL